MSTTIYITKNLWDATIEGLAKRSSGRKESACIWAGERKAQWTVKDLIFLDDLPGTQGYRKYHKTPREAVNVLFKMLRDKGLQIIADIHTHPGYWVDLSLIDRESPIEYRVGLLAVVFPNFARLPMDIEKVGFHEYLGKSQWRRLTVPQIKERIIISGGKYGLFTN